MGLLRLYLRQEIDELDEKRVRIRFIGERTRLAPDIVDLIDESERRTETNTALNLVVAFKLWRPSGNYRRGTQIGAKGLIWRARPR